MLLRCVFVCGLIAFGSTYSLDKTVFAGGSGSKVTNQPTATQGIEMEEMVSKKNPPIKESDKKEPKVKRSEVKKVEATKTKNGQDAVHKNAPQKEFDWNQFGYSVFLSQPNF